MKNWQRYPEYKDSGVEWLGEIPKHWEVKKLKYVCQILRGKFTHRPRNDPRFYDGSYPFIQTGDVAAANKYITTHKQTLNDLGFAVSKEFPKGTLIMTIAANIGDIAILDFAACFPDSIVGFVPENKNNLNYLYYNFLAMRPDLLKTATLNTQMNLNVDQIGSLLTILPPLSEQKSIAHFLDRETSKLDKLIAKKERFIELLQEKRTALISHAVTKGLNPNVPMKDSGISWLGQIPNHWEVKPLRAILEQRYEYNRGIKTENLLSVIKDVGVINYEDREASGNKKSENIEQYKIIYPGDIVVNRMNLIFGSVGISKSYGASSTEYYVLKPKSENTDNLYYSYIFCNKSFQQSLIGIGKGILFHRMRIYSEEFKKIIFPIPPLSEQKAIADFLDQETAKIDTLIEKTKTSIEKLKEYRTALISAAVTGKIDIREEI
ncbi:restriction endonuclease subunit S [Planktothricoides raciborskii]|uniref:Restriction endonuclease subunit S n=1 Tax=Planktothricoides raciborskii FACHB-1370 TaxID=2949576 RepID=A0ABR8EDN9_9CYAN|nr:restriction endonuclease subunit S [Planktothricoides raciborskii]MBD2544746.1 restriction endonuclease subunit S [Planktothricoides raciborskii FACHB-1370]MBD2582847.1 restriction endonuclease subunit S [Planktothricoides raciborskii FACHB-1261]